MKLIHKYYLLTAKTKKHPLIKELTKQQEYCRKLHNRTKKDNKQRIAGYLNSPFSCQLPCEISPPDVCCELYTLNWKYGSFQVVCLLSV